MSSGKVKCTCGWSWNKSDSSKKDMYICHECGRDNSNNMQNGGWLDNYADGGTMQEHQENYNNSSVSLPEGFVGIGNNTKGRNYSPAWGGQFAEGGEIDPTKKPIDPPNKKGAATRADSLAVYNDLMKTKNYYETHNTKYFEKPKISKQWWADKKTMDDVQKEHLGHKDVTAANKQKIRQNKNPNQYLLSDMITGAIDSNAPLFRYDTRIAPQGEVTYTPKTYLKPALKKLDPNYDRLSGVDQLAIEDMMRGYSSNMIPEERLIYKKWKGKHPHDLEKMKALAKLDDDVNNHAPGYITTLPYYDPIAVKPWDMLTDAEKKLRIQKYGPNQTKNKPVNVPTKNPPVVERKELTPIQTMSVGMQDDNQQIGNPDVNINVLRRGPKGYKYNSVEGGTHSSGWITSPDQLQHLQGLKEMYDEKEYRDWLGTKNKIDIIPQYQMGGKLKSSIPVIEDAGNYNEEGRWVPDWKTMTAQAKKLGAKKVKTKHGSLIVFNDNWEVVGVDDNPDAMQMGGSIPGAVGFSYARTNDPAPSNGPYAKKTKASAQEGINIVPIKGRSHYSPLSNSIYLDETNGPSVKGHELYHYQQHQEGRDFIPEKWNWGPYLPPSQPQTPYTEEAASLGYNRRRLEAEGILQDMYKYMPDLQFMPKEVVEEGFNLSSGIHMQGIEDNMYDNPYTLEGEARLTETPEGRQQLEERGIGVRQFQNGGWLDQYDVAQTGMRILNEGDDFMKNNSRGKFNKAGKDLDQIIANNKERQKNRVVDIRQSPKKAVNDKIAASKKLHTTDLDKLNVRNKTQAEIDAEEAAYNKSVAEQRKATREKSDANVLNDWSEFFDSDNHTRQNWEDSTAGLESKFRVSDEPNFFDDYLNPFSMIGGMAADLGASPNQAKQTDSYLPYVTAIGTPLLTGALEGIGAKSNKEFVNNLINPANIVPGYKSAEKYLAPKIKKTLAKGALPILEGAKNLETLGREAVRGINDAVIYPIKYRKQIADVKKLHGELASQLGQDEGVKRLSGVLGIDPTNLDYPSLTTFPRIGSHYSPRLNNINMDFRQLNKFKNSPELMLSANTVHGHEVGHWMQREADRFSPKYKEALSNYNNSNNKSIFFEPLPTSNPTVIDRFAQQLYGYDRGTNMIDISDALSNQVDVNTLYDNAKYFTHQGTEALPHLREMRQNMLNKGYIKNIYDPISEETINKFISENPIDRISSFTKPGSKQTKGLETIFRNLPSVVGAGAVGTGAAYQMQNQQGAPQYEEGGVIKDDLGQWAHPGEITEINSNDITMEGVPYDVLGISDTGDTKLMKPGKKYKFKGKKVTEFPMAKNGLRQEQKGLVNLDNLTNFTNYNTKQPGGWLDQY